MRRARVRPNKCRCVSRSDSKSKDPAGNVYAPRPFRRRGNQIANALRMLRREPRIRGFGSKSGGTPTFDAVREPVDVTEAVADRALRGVPAQPAAFVTVDDDGMVEIAVR